MRPTSLFATSIAISPATSTLRFAAALIAACVIVGCGAGAPLPPITLKTLGMSCMANGDCGSMMCHAGVCARTCTKQGDCPTGFDCGLVKPEDGQMGGVGATCYKSTFDNSMNGFGTDCSVFSPDPKTEMPCGVPPRPVPDLGGTGDDAGTAGDGGTMMADASTPRDLSVSPGDADAGQAGGIQNPCAKGFTCRSHLRCDPDAYCTKGCQSDIDCPPTMFCGVDTGPVCMTDDQCTGGMKCMAPPGGSGAIKICQGSPVCLKRTACSTCGNDDQCPSGHTCAVDKNGERFCGKVCKPEDSMGNSNQCPQPENDQMNGALSMPFQQCVDAGNGSGKDVCRPTSGACHGPSALMALGGKSNTICSPCRPNLPGDCPEGVCFSDSFDLEHFCTVPCMAKATASQSGLMVTSDSCPMGTYCFAAGNCSKTCTLNGICGGDMNQNSNGFETYLIPTCFPLGSM